MWTIAILLLGAAGITDLLLAPRIGALSRLVGVLRSWVELSSRLDGVRGEDLAGEKYHEFAPQAILLAFLYRVVNGGGHVTRESSSRSSVTGALTRYNRP